MANVELSNLPKSSKLRLYPGNKKESKLPGKCGDGATECGIEVLGKLYVNYRLHPGLGKSKK